MAALSIKDFPDKTYRELKIMAATEGVTLRDLVIRVLQQHAESAPGKGAKR